MQKFIAYSTKPATLVFLLFVAVILIAGLWFYAEGGWLAFYMALLVYAIYVIAVVVKIKRGQL